MDTPLEPTAAQPPLHHGVEVIRHYVQQLPRTPGVYRMLDAAGNVLYVGKAKSLRSRVASYANTGGLSQRIARMVSLTASMEFITTQTEAEALLLEANLIKKLAPRYNILLRDDKSFPYILIHGEHAFPRITKHRGSHHIKGLYFGPFASAGAVNETLATLQKAFLLRPCTDYVFASRTRPCLQYQIKRCSAPCVGYISEQDYAALIAQAGAFLHGKSHEIQQELAQQMQQASEAMDFETAALLRDRIRALTRVQQEQRLQSPSLGDADVIALSRGVNKTCIQLFYFRSGQNFGNKSYFLSHAQEAQEPEILSAFIGQLYQTQTPPKTILLSHPAEQTPLLEQALALRAGYKVQLQVPQRGDKYAVMLQVLRNAQQALERHMAEHAGQQELLEAVARLFALDAPPQRIEIYDNSHIMGRHALGAMVVAGPEGFIKNAYRRFNFTGGSMSLRSSAAQAHAEPSARHSRAVDGMAPHSGSTPADTSVPTGGDDYAMMREMLWRRFSRLQKDDPDRLKDHNWPDLLLIDGGAAHMATVQELFADMGINIPFVCIAKGQDRNAGREWFHLPGITPFQLPPNDPVLHYLQRLRDEAHRFAIGSHRNKRSSAIRKSELDDIPGIGATRKKALLHHFGSARAVASATLQDLETVTGINKKTALAIYSYFHS